MQDIKTDVLVIGAGSGGLSVAAGAAQMGADVTLLEGHEMGGDCLNFGCVPSKALIASGKAAHGQAHSSIYGVADQVPQVDYAAAKAHVKDVIAQIAPVDSQERFEGFGVRVIREYGRFVSPKVVEAGDHRITARRVVIATGSSPLVPPIPGLDSVPYLTNETLFDLTETPEHLLIIGGGPIGMEMAQAHQRLGIKVTVIEGAKALGRDDPEMAAIVLDNLRSEGLEIAEDAMAKQISGQAGAITVETQDGRSFTGSHLLVAVGRKANVDKLNLATAGIETTKTGIKVDDSMKTTNRKVYAIGDVAGGAQFTHVAGYHAGVIIRSALFGLPAKARTDHIPYATYTDPELAQIGPTEAEARKIYGDKLTVARFEIEHNDRLIAERKAKGLIKAMVVKGRPVGVSIAGPQAGELINLWALVIANKLKMSAVAGMVAPYPTVGEINKRVAGAYFSPQLFDNPKVKRVVGFVQRWLP
ncbi:FAD-dependent oxidoreductase [Shimia sp. R9_2]|uniref:dihydrolipoyl dehydrogenase family protein n=1 Tax=Shimia sp. R9_2 TaxID=2821112 RepID=UPI001ADBE25F|nr:FAD-dependent oxidoreductase [Shimia sp. R9_2]MBO9398097.1 FAD-dependent oxidoreductase [Shimia sp. R9_2]